MLFNIWRKNRKFTEKKKFHVFSTPPGSFTKSGAESWECPANHRNLDSEQAKECASDLEKQGHLVRIVPDELRNARGWKSNS